jgi:hypothetical protein
MFRWTVTIVAIAMLAPSTRAGDADPFADWTPEQIEKHKVVAAQKIGREMRRDLTAWKGLYFACSSCDGRGNRGGVRCLTCGGTGVGISEKKLRILAFDLFPAKFRTAEKTHHFDWFLQNPDETLKVFPIIDAWRRKDIEVLGNYASAVCEVKQNRVWTTLEFSWIQVYDEWRIRDKEADKDFRSIRYDGTSPDPAVAAPPPSEQPPAPAPQPTPGGQPAPEDKPSPPPPAQAEPHPPPPKPKEDPATLFEVKNVSIRPSEEGTFKVIGTISNKTERRFRYVTVRVTLWKGDKMVDTCEATIGKELLEAHGSAAFDSFLYRDDAPVYDRIETKVVDYTEVQ